jgi:hypothetical protein
LPSPIVLSGVHREAGYNTYKAILRLYKLLDRIAKPIASIVNNNTITINSTQVSNVVTVTRGDVLPSIPSEPRIHFLSNQSGNLGDIMYVSMQEGDGDWNWYQVLKARAS